MTSAQTGLYFVLVGSSSIYTVVLTTFISAFVLRSMYSLLVLVVELRYLVSGKYDVQVHGIKHSGRHDTINPWSWRCTTFGSLMILCTLSVPYEYRTGSTSSVSIVTSTCRATEGMTQ